MRKKLFILVLLCICFYQYTDICIYTTLAISNQTTFVKVFDNHVEEECIFPGQDNLIHAPSVIFFLNDPVLNLSETPHLIWKPPVIS